jgi:hypothetical protein
MVKRTQTIAISTHEPFSKEGLVFALPFNGKQKEVADNYPPTSRRSAIAWPSRAGGDIDVVVHGNLFTRDDQSASHQKRRTSIEELIRVRIAAMVRVAIRKSKQHNSTVRIITVICFLTEVNAQREVGRDLPNDADTPYPLPRLE